MAGEGPSAHQRTPKLNLPVTAHEGHLKVTLPADAHDGQSAASAGPGYARRLSIKAQLPQDSATAAGPGYARRLSVKAQLPQDSAKLISAISREDLLQRQESNYATGTPQQRKLVTVGSVKYRSSKGNRENKNGEWATQINIATKHGNANNKIENTFRMEPTVKFRCSRAEEVIKSVFRELIAPNSSYPSRTQDARHLIKMATNEIRNKTRMFNYDRYRVVVFVTLGERAGQALRMASRCLWTPSVDTFASATHETRNMFIVGVVYAIYAE